MAGSKFCIGAHEDDQARWKHAAMREGLSLSEWIRRKVDGAPIEGNFEASKEKAGELAILELCHMLTTVRRIKDLRSRVMIVKAGLEVGGLIGQRAGDLHLHQHNQFSQQALEMIAAKVKELKEGGYARLSEGSEGEGQDQEDDDGVQGRILTLGVQDGPLSEVQESGYSDSAQSGS